MESTMSVAYGVVVGCLGALVTIVVWAIVGISRQYMRGCLGEFITFVVIEIPFGLGLPIGMLGILPTYVPSLAGRKLVPEIYGAAIIMLLLLDVVTKVRRWLDARIFR